MSDRVDHGSFGGTSVQPPYQSAWMAHWKQKPSTGTHNFLSLRQNDGHAELQPSPSEPQMTTASISNFPQNYSGSRPITVVNDSLKSRGLKLEEEEEEEEEENVDNRFFPMFNPSSTLALKNNPASFVHGGAMSSHTTPLSNPAFDKSESHLLPLLEKARCEIQCPSKEHPLQSSSISRKPELHSCLEKNSLGTVDSFQDNVGSSSKTIPYEQNSTNDPLQRLPLSVEDVETMRICTTVDSVENVLGGSPKHHKAKHHFFFTKRTGFNLSEGGQVFRESSVSTKFKGNMLSEFLNLSPNFNFHGDHGLKLQSPGKETVGDVNSSRRCFKNEASAETDTMEMDYIRNNHFSDADLSPLCKNILRAQNSATSRALVGSTPEGNEDGLPRTIIPDINEELPAPPAEVCSMDEGETSTSRTQSLDMDHLLSHAEHPTNFKSTGCADDITGPVPSSRWAKRLKLRSSDPFLAYGTKNSKMAETFPHEKVNRLLSQTMKCSPRSSAPAAGNKLVPLDQTAALLKDDISSSSDSVRKDEDISLSHPWIRRWCRSVAASPQKKAEAVRLSEPETSTFNDFQNKQFPSIAAMALMGKALNGFQPCEFKKRVCLVVWNTKQT